MEMKDRIEVNDIVCVNFNLAQNTLTHSARVLALPMATGDSWIFKDLNSELIHYVSEGCTVTLLRKQEPITE